MIIRSWFDIDWDRFFSILKDSDRFHANPPSCDHLECLLLVFTFSFGGSTFYLHFCPHFSCYFYDAFLPCDSYLRTVGYGTLRTSRINLWIFLKYRSDFITFRMSRSRSRSRSRSYSPSRPQSKENGDAKTEHKEVKIFSR